MAFKLVKTTTQVEHNNNGYKKLSSMQGWAYKWGNPNGIYYRYGSFGGTGISKSDIVRTFYWPRDSDTVVQRYLSSIVESRHMRHVYDENTIIKVESTLGRGEFVCSLDGCYRLAYSKGGRCSICKNIIQQTKKQIDELSNMITSAENSKKRKREDLNVLKDLYDESVKLAHITSGHHKDELKALQEKQKAELLEVKRRHATELRVRELKLAQEKESYKAELKKLETTYTSKLEKVTSNVVQTVEARILQNCEKRITEAVDHGRTMILKTVNLLQTNMKRLQDHLRANEMENKIGRHILEQSLCLNVSKKVDLSERDLREHLFMHVKRKICEKIQPHETASDPGKGTLTEIDQSYCKHNNASVKFANILSFMNPLTRAVKSILPEGRYPQEQFWGLLGSAALTDRERIKLTAGLRDGEGRSYIFENSLKDNWRNPEIQQQIEKLTILSFDDFLVTYEHRKSTDNCVLKVWFTVINYKGGLDGRSALVINKEGC